MPRPANPLRRAVITAVISLVGLIVCAVIFIGQLRSGGSTPGAPTPTQTAPATSAAPTQTVPPATTPAQGTPGETADATPAEPAAPRTTEPLPALRARSYPSAAAPFASLGSIDAGAGYQALVTFTSYGAGVESITLADHFVDTERTQHYPIQSRTRVAGANGAGLVVSPLATVGVEIASGSGRGVFVDLRLAREGSLWRETAPGAFEAMIESEAGAEIARITKRFTLAPGSYDIEVHQTLENLSGRDLRVRWYTYGPADLPKEQTGYSLDPRRVRIGKLLSPAVDPSRMHVVADSKLAGRAAIIKSAQRGLSIWPSERFTRAGDELVWVATTARYFAFIVHPLIPGVDTPATPDKRLHEVEQVLGVVLGGDPKSAALILQLNGPEIAVGAGESVTTSLGAYAGPLHDDELNSEPLFLTLSLSDIIVYNLGGMCASCTFQPLAIALLWFLRLVEHYLVFDWAIAIMLLVLVVRAILHPVTRRSQISLARFSKQMQGLAPKQAALKEKFKDDPKALQQEMVKLMREEGVSMTGALGCLPMFLQTPVWIALYAMLYFNFELRHEPAFFGVFQAISGGRWSFLADLSAPDHFIDFGAGFNIPLISTFMGPISGLNILPLLLGIVFFMQQKYLTPPTTAALTPEQQQQQKIMKFMMVVMFPVFMYNAPSGLSIYFVTNSTLGILESRWIRAHINQLDLQPKKKPARPGVKRVRNEAPANPFLKHRAAGEKKYKKRGE